LNCRQRVWPPTCQPPQSVTCTPHTFCSEALQQLATTSCMRS
jgi:hypothetical protein